MAEAKERHGLRRAQCRGQGKVRIQALGAAMADDAKKLAVGRRNRARMGATIAHPSRMIDVLALLLRVLSSAVRTRRV